MILWRSRCEFQTSFVNNLKVDATGPETATGSKVDAAAANHSGMRTSNLKSTYREQVSPYLIRVDIAIDPLIHEKSVRISRSA